ncbi:hypothetical protein VB780_25980 [Leptolyngbya sp. CCNP1308]|uniref:hypothetical protein n=1 Tax=Leptolyngbya sp. CCNP1308 TaxID=3110255 RepID=UPI002B1F3ACA|nr:hypothetical protein [Leptolyngbya sp. CCNP1308]MEA5452050.1 hypothetical protein [Leptolyngbya sp. CCNP1308]
METLLAQVLELLQQRQQQQQQDSAQTDRVLSVLEELVADSSQRKTWVKPETLTQRVGDAITASRLKTDLRAGYFKQGVHYIITSNGAHKGWSHHAWNPEAIRKFYETPPEKRRIY